MPASPADHHDHGGSAAEATFRNRFFLVLTLVIPVLALSPTIQDWTGVAFNVPYAQWILFGLSTIIAGYGGLPFYAHALMELRTRQYGMMTLVSIAVLSGYAFSAASTFWVRGVDFYWEISTLVLVLLFGHWMEARAVRGSSRALEQLARLIPDVAHLVIGAGDAMDRKTAELVVGDRVLVKPGEKVPVDGTIVSGQASMNEAMITGESRPVVRRAGDTVIGGTIALDGSLMIETTRIGSDTALARIIRLVQEAQESKPDTQRLADRAARWLTIAAIVGGAATFLIWSLFTAQGVVFALTLAITVIVIACPHALGLAIPTVTTIVSGMAARRGILIKKMAVVERATAVTHVVMDKTGTLTTGAFAVHAVRSLADLNDVEVLRLAASVDFFSPHVIARGIVAKARERGISFSSATRFVSYPGMGSEGTVQERQVLVGNQQLMERFGQSVKAHASAADALAREGDTVVWVAYDGRIIGVIGLSDTIREESPQAVAELKRLGVAPVMLTGDRKDVADAVARELGIDTVFSEVLPEQKTDIIRQLQASGAVVAMVGDGVNDAPSLTQADIGIAIGAGTDVAIESADVVLVKSDPRDVLAFLRLSRRTVRKMTQNLVWAAGYNVVAIPVAAGVLYPFGVILRPEWGALLMSASSVIVVANAFLLTLRDPAK
ncbi:MAG: heavy metal translocating P-type ATPase [Candidatus Liptonbacteria bacterium]|nr:heavy metal translocating P-type ATPase [Candidatus Liptonbacteria bacterium]